MSDFNMEELIKEKNIMTKKTLEEIEKKFVDNYNKNRDKNVNHIIGKTLTDPNGFSINVSYYNMINKRLRQIHLKLISERDCRPTLKEVKNQIILNKDKYTPNLNKEREKER